MRHELREAFIILCITIGVVLGVCGLMSGLVALLPSTPVADPPDVPVCELPFDWQQYYPPSFANCASVSIKRSA